MLLTTARVRELIEDKDRTKEIPDAIAQGNVSYGMQTFDQSLMWLLKSGVITYEEALRQATNPDDFALRVSGISRHERLEVGRRSSRPPEAAPAAAPPAAAARPASGRPASRRAAPPRRRRSPAPPPRTTSRIERF